MADVNTITAETLEKLLEWAKNGAPGGDGPIIIPTNSITEAHLQNNSVSTRTIQNGAITAAKLDPSIPIGGGTGAVADGAVTETKIADNSVSTRTIQTAAINETKLQDNAVSTRTIRNGSITAAKLDPSIPIGGGTGNIADGAVSEIKIQDGAVSTRALANKAVTEPKLGDAAVSTRAIANGAITQAKLDSSIVVGIADGSINELKLANNSISTVKVKDGAITAAKLAPDVVTGNANVEVTAARTEPAGRTFTTLKDRLDSQATSWVNVKWFGAKGDYAQALDEQLGTGTDDSQAFKNAIAYIVDSMTRNSEYNDQAVRYGLYIPAGRYLIRQVEALMLGTYTLPAKGGLVYEGAGNPTTEIIYDPLTASNTAMLNNQNAFNWITFRDICFTSTGVARGTLYNTFMLSKSVGQAQNYYFERCHWAGGWKEMMRLVGDNTNSEMSWVHCGFSEMFENAIYVPYVEPATPDNSGNDQFVNYSFYNTNFEVTRGTWMNFQKGGSVNIYGGSLIYHGDKTGMQTNGTMFVLGNAVHNQGACRFNVDGARVELNNELAQWMRCDWTFGLVSFNQVDQSVHSWHPNDTNVINTVFNIGDDTGPIITWSNCQIQGQHKYMYDSNGFTTHDYSINYENSEFIQHNQASTFFTMEDTRTVNPTAGITPVIHINGCRNQDPKIAVDCDFGWSNSATASTQRRIKMLRDSTNKIGTEGSPEIGFKLPLNSIITKVVFYIAPGATTSTATGWEWWVDVNRTSPDPATWTKLGLAKPIGDNPRLGVNSTVELFYVCDTEDKRKLAVTSSTAVTTSLPGYVFVEYIGG